MWKSSFVLILASKSEARKALLDKAGLAFEARSANVNERDIEARALGDGEGPAGVAQKLAEAKAIAFRRGVILGGDQVLEFEGRLLHKPESVAEARQTLLSLRGKTHLLHSGFALCRDGWILASGVETARLTMREFSDAELDDVLREEGGAVLQSVGGYRIEGPTGKLFASVEGSEDVVMGLPMAAVLEALREHAPEVLR